jgi:hypothetical protein
MKTIEQVESVRTAAIQRGDMDTHDMCNDYIRWAFADCGDRVDLLAKIGATVARIRRLAADPGAEAYDSDLLSWADTLLECANHITATINKEAL